MLYNVCLVALADGAVVSSYFFHFYAVFGKNYATQQVRTPHPRVGPPFLGNPGSATVL